MNILIVVDVDWIEKITYEIHHLSELFSLYGHKVYAVDIPSQSKLFEFKKYETIKDYHRIHENASVTLLRTPVLPIRGLNRVSAYVASYSFIKNVLKNYKIDVVLMYSVVNLAKATIKACKEMKIPIIHRTFEIVHKLIRERYLEKIVLRIEKDVYPKFDKVIANTPQYAQWAKSMGALNTIVIPQGVDTKILHTIPVDEELQKKLGIKQDEKVVMYLGTLQSFCGLDVLIKKIPYILTKIPDFKLLVVGGGPFLNKLKEQSKSLNVEERVVFTGFQPYRSIPNYCSLATLCINTFKINEMTDKLSPLKIFDMQACGKPVLSTPLQGLLVDFPPASSGVVYSQLEDFHTAIINFLNYDEKLVGIGQRGRQLIERNFTWEKTAKQFLEEFAQILDSHPNK